MARSNSDAVHPRVRDAVTLAPMLLFCGIIISVRCRDKPMLNDAALSIPCGALAGLALVRSGRRMGERSSTTVEADSRRGGLRLSHADDCVNDSHAPLKQNRESL